MLEVGTKAPEFTLPDKDGNPVPNGIFRGGNLFSCNGDTDRCCATSPRSCR